MAILTAVIRFVVSFTVHRGFDAAENAYKKSKNKKQEEQAQQMYGQQGQTPAQPAQPVQQPAAQQGRVAQSAPQSGQNAGGMQDYYNVAAAYGIVIHSLGEDYGKKVDVPAPQPAQQAQPVQQVKPVQQAPQAQPADRYRQPADGYRQPQMGYGQQPEPPKKGLGKGAVIGILVAAMILCLVCGFFGAKYIYNRFHGALDVTVADDSYQDEQQTVDEQQIVDDSDEPDYDEEVIGDSEVGEDAGLVDKKGKTCIKISEIPDMQMLLHLLKQVRFTYGDQAFDSAEDPQYENPIGKT